MTKDEYVKTLEKYIADNDLEQEDGLTYLDGIQEAATLARQLDEPKRVVIPPFAADWIKKPKVYYGDEVAPMIITNWIRNYAGSVESHYKWLSDIGNQKLLFNAIANGYEVKKEIEKYVKLKGFDGTTGYLNYDVTYEKFFVDTIELDGCTKIKFTKSWLKDNWSEYEVYNNAGLLEFEEVAS